MQSRMTMRALGCVHLQLPAHRKAPGEGLEPPGPVQPQQRGHIALIPLVWVPHSQYNLHGSFTPSDAPERCQKKCEITMPAASRDAVP